MTKLYDMGDQNHVNFDVFGVNVRLDFGEDAPEDLEPQVRDIWAGALTEDRPSDTVVTLPHTGRDHYLEQLSSKVTIAALDVKADQAMLFHAAGIATPDGRVLAFVGPSGRGKTTLSKTLSQYYGYVSDETIAVDDNLTVYPYRKPLSVKRPDKPKLQVSPYEAQLLELPNAPLRLTRLIILDRSDDIAAPTIEPVSLRTAFESLVHETSYLARMKEPLQRFASICERTGGVLRVAYSEAETLVDIVPELLATDSQETAWAPALPSTSPEPAIAGCDRYACGHVIDAISADGNVVLLTDKGMLHILDGIGPTLWDAARQGASLPELTKAVTAEHGNPPNGDAAEMVSARVAELTEADLLKLTVAEV